MRREDIGEDNSYIEGRNSVSEALRAGHEINKMWILKPAEGRRLEPDLARILGEANDRHIVVVRVNRQALDKMSTTGNHQGVIAQIASHDSVDLEDIVNKAEDLGCGGRRRYHYPQTPVNSFEFSRFQALCRSRGICTRSEGD